MTSKKNLNIAILKLTENLYREGYDCFCLGYGGCPLCNPCKQVEGQPCAFPDKRISCMSAYCIDVGKLANKCGLEFAWVPEKLFLFDTHQIERIYFIGLQDGEGLAFLQKLSQLGSEEIEEDDAE